MNISNNIRFQSTQQSIQKAFFRLLKKKTFDNIFVKDICMQSGINRSTFYAHYQDINDMMIKIEESLSEKIITIFSGTEFGEQEFIDCFQFIKEHREFYTVYLQNNQSSFIERTSFFDYQKKLKSSSQLQTFNQSELFYHMVFFASGLKGLCKAWLLDGCKQSPQEMAAIIKVEYKDRI